MTTLYNCVSGTWDPHPTYPYKLHEFIAMCRYCFGVTPNLQETADGEWVDRDTGETVLVPVKSNNTNKD